MIEGDIAADQTMRHLRTGVHYQVRATGKMKMGPTQGEGLHQGWVPSVIYSPVSGGDSIFTRDEATFRQNFERVVQEPEQ